jgi:uncharacterized protein with HEPN domain
VRSDRLYLEDILDAIAEIAHYLPANKADFDANPLLQSHIYRHVQIIGEAVFKLSDPLKVANPDVTWTQIAGMRHVLVHDYFKVNWNRVYATAHDNVPKLKEPVERIIGALPPTPLP